MNLKLNNDRSSPVRMEPLLMSSAEERRRTGRYIAILVGISLILLAIYQAWVRRIHVIASLLVPALIMFLYIAWILFYASRDKRNKAKAAADLEADLMEHHLATSTPPLIDVDRHTPERLTDAQIQEEQDRRFKAFQNDISSYNTSTDSTCIPNQTTKEINLGNFPKNRYRIRRGIKLGDNYYDPSMVKMSNHTRFMAFLNPHELRIPQRTQRVYKRSYSIS